MGAKESILSEEQIDEYTQLTYLHKTEILYILKKFTLLGLKTFQENLQYRFPKKQILDLYPELKHNPFCDRIFYVFSSLQDDKFSIEDFLDLCSVFSLKCPLAVKAAWAFRIFDFNNDGIITKEDISDIIDRLTEPLRIFKPEKDHICEILLEEMDLQNKGGLSQLEFVHAMSKMPEFERIFSFRP